MKTKLLFLFVTILIFTSCGEYNKVLKSRDPEVKYTYAKKYFDEGKYGRAITLLEEIQTSYIALPQEQEVLFLLAQSYFYDKDYESAAVRFNRYYNKFPRGNYSEIALFNSAQALYNEDPDVRLDQSSTIRAMEGFQNFLENFPKSDKVSEAQTKLLELQNKLADKELRATQLYYNLGYYMGNNYESCVVTAKEALKRYNYPPFGEEFQIMIIRAKFDEAEMSFDEKKPVRYRNVMDEYFNYMNMYPEGKYVAEALKYYKKSLASVGKTENDLTIDTTVIEQK